MTTYQSTSTSAWDSNYKAVYHFGNGSTLSLTDSSTNANNLTNVAGHLATATTGAVGGGINFSGSQYAQKTSASGMPTGTAARTLSGWIQLGSGTSATAGETGGYGANTGNGSRFALYWAGSNTYSIEQENVETNMGYTYNNNWHYVVRQVPAPILPLQAS